MTSSATKFALLALGFFSGALGGVLAAQARTTSEAPAAHAARPQSAVHVALVQDVAVGCGVYGLPGSPAVVALTAGEDGRPARAALESDIFGGDDAEACLLKGVAALPMSRDSLRVVLPVYTPEDGAGETLAVR